MTFEELKAEAKAQGYKLVKETPYIRQLPCICGAKNTICWYVSGSGGKSFLECKKCGFKGGTGITQREIKIAWNEAVENAERK